MNCGICKRQMDVPGDPASLSCGGGCLQCMAEVARDPDCQREMLLAPKSLRVIRAALLELMTSMALGRPLAPAATELLAPGMRFEAPLSRGDVLQVLQVMPEVES